MVGEMDLKMSELKKVCVCVSGVRELRCYCARRTDRWCAAGLLYTFPQGASPSAPLSLLKLVQIFFTRLSYLLGVQQPEHRHVLLMQTRTKGRKNGKARQKKHASE